MHLHEYMYELTVAATFSVLPSIYDFVLTAIEVLELHMSHLPTIYPLSDNICYPVMANSKGGMSIARSQIHASMTAIHDAAAVASTAASKPSR